MQENRAKLADVGMAKMMTLGQHSSHQSVDFAMGTFAWAAPEMLMGEELTPAVDVYSLGVVLWEIVTQVSLAPASAAARLDHVYIPPTTVCWLRALSRKRLRKLPACVFDCEPSTGSVLPITSRHACTVQGCGTSWSSWQVTDSSVAGSRLSSVVP